MKNLISLALLLSLPTHAQILVDEGWGSSHKINESNYSYSAPAAFSAASELKARKKIGIHTTLMGATAVAGLGADLNFTSSIALSLGVGLASGFSTFNSHLKYSMCGKDLCPYFVGGYSRWYADGTKENLDKTTPGILGNKFLTRREKQTGVFSENLVYPGIGLEFINTSGDYVGLGFFGELDLLLDLDSFDLGPVAGVGSVYYF